MNKLFLHLGTPKTATTERTVQPLTMNEEMLLRLLFEVCYNDEVREELDVGGKS